MLHPKKGEGEHRSIIRKGPQLFTAALLIATPICMAQVATDAYANERTSLLLSQTQAQKGLVPQSGSFLGQSLQTKWSSNLPNSTDIDNLQSTLSSYKSQLATLRAKTPKDPKVQAALDTAISALESDIQILEEALAKLKTTFQLLTKNKLTLSSAVEAYNLAIAAKTKATQELEAATSSRLLTLNTKSEKENNLITTNAELDAKQQARNNAKAEVDSAVDAVNAANLDLENARAARTAAQQAVNEAANILSTKSSELDAAISARASSLQEVASALQAKNAAEQQLALAQAAYDTNLIPDPTWTMPTYQKENTRLVPYTEIQVVKTLVPTTTMIATGGVKAEVFDRQGYNNAPPLPSANETPISTTTVSTIDFNWGSGNVLNSGRSEDVIVRFTANLLVPQDGYYQFYASADDGTKLNIAGMDVLDDWFDKGGGGSISDPVYIRAGIFYPFTLHYYENGGGAAVNFYTYSPQQGFSVVPSTWMGSSAEQQTTYEEVITYEEVTKYREEIYYTTEPVLAEGTIQVRINEGGEATFVAPAGATFISSNLRYEAIGDPTCGADISPRNLGGNIIQLVADNSIWGDPCGGQYKHITGTLSYLGQPTAPLIKDPALLPTLQEAQSNYSSATSNYNAKVTEGETANQQVTAAQSNYNLALVAKTSADEDLAFKETNFTLAASTLSDSSTLLASKQTVLGNADALLLQATTNKDLAATELQQATTEADTAETNFQTATATLTSADLALTTATTNKTASEEEVATSEVSLTGNSEAVQRVSTISFSQVEELLNKEPEPLPEEEGSKEIPAVLTAANLLEVDLSAVDPTELTEAQAEQLVEAALETFLTAEEGSAEYEQALDALYLAAEQDDIELPEELAAIPGLADAVAVLNFLGNAGADMSPKVREESEKVVVATVVAAGAAIQSAAAAATTASAGAASSGGSRRIGK